jgi:hypothetical protein
MPASSVREAIHEAMVALGGEATAGIVHDWIERQYPGRWRDISTPMRDLAFPRLPSSQYPDAACFLDRVGHGRYRLRR